MVNKNQFGILTLCIATMVSFTACKKNKSNSTGWEYNKTKWGGFANIKYKGQETGPGLALVEGGRFKMGSLENNLLYDNNNTEKTVTVQSFYMDETEVSNLHYCEYLYWLNMVWAAENLPHAQKALPDTNCWRSKLGYNEPFVEYYLRHPAYKDYPVVGVNWQQATEYAKWRTDRVNEMILDREGLIKREQAKEVGRDNFDTRAYLAGQDPHLTKGKKYLKDYSKKKGKRQQVTMSDGILLPDYRLPTEAEWEYAAKGAIGQTQFENVEQDQLYPWSDYTLRVKDQKEKDRGKIMLNVMRGKGDFGGIANGNLNDAGFITTPVFSYWPNAYGLYNMSGNVSEWVMDVYRPLSLEDMDGFMPFRGNVYQVVRMDPIENVVAEKDDLGRIIQDTVSRAMNVNRRNYQVADNIGFRDELNYSSDLTYEYGVTSLINNKARVYKGGGWADRSYWANPGTRRYLDQEQSLSTLGFRCCMTRIGSPVGNSRKRYNNLPSSGINKKTKKGKR